MTGAGGVVSNQMLGSNTVISTESILLCFKKTLLIFLNLGLNYSTRRFLHKSLTMRTKLPTRLDYPKGSPDYSSKTKQMNLQVQYIRYNVHLYLQYIIYVLSYYYWRPRGTSSRDVARKNVTSGRFNRE